VLLGERLSYGKWRAQLRVPGEWTLIATIAIAFLVLHILAGTILQRAAADGPTAPQQAAPSSLYD
jgi:hypothetical protein